MDAVTATVEREPHMANGNDEIALHGAGDEVGSELGDPESESTPPEKDVVDDGLDEEGDGKGGLFSSDSEDEGVEIQKNQRKLDDEDLDSGDDEGRNDRVDDHMDGDDGEEDQGEDSVVMELQLGRHAVPDGSDRELYLLKFPSFLGLDPTMFHPKGFQPPQTNHHSTSAPPPDFSRYNVAINSLRWRHSPQNPSKLESNAKIIRWSDGSLTLQVANSPKEQFELPAKPLAPPQIDPPKPTPTSKRKGRNINGTSNYNSQLDSHTFLVTPQESAQLLRITHHITSSLTVLPSSDANDEALSRLQDSLAAAVRGNKSNADGSIGIISITEDPELAKKKAEVAERDRIRAVKKRQQHEVRESERANRVLGKSGLSRGGAGGLSVGALEDDDLPAPLRKRKTGMPGHRKKASGRGRDSDTDDDIPRGRTREDEYDKDDGFLADSDEEEEFEDGKGDEEEEEEEEEEAVDQGSDEDARTGPKGRASPKRERELERDRNADEPFTGPRGKRRRVIEEDEDDE
ncbi:MAG: hypothetical protein M1837_004964 [Sclerophora amabilis]|nr:MAG: hypothetical protein M1837_004964 [Sclerophora amabilis]